MSSRTARPTFVVIPCSAAKIDTAAPARDLYSASDNFRATLAAAESDAWDGATVLILSALHGLLTLDQVVAPYNVKMGDPGSVTVETIAEQAQALGMTWEARADVYAMLPGAYFRKLDAALRLDDVYAADVYEAAPGIGYQRGTVSSIRRSAAA